MRRKWTVPIGLLVVLTLLLSACAPAPTPVVVEKEKVVEKPVVQTVVVEKEKVVEKPVVQTVVVEKEKTVVVEKEVVITPTSVPEKVAERPLIWGTPTDPVTLDPAVNRYWYSRLAQRGPYEPLLEYEWNEEGTGFVLEPVLATSWEVSDDGLTYTYHLREGVKFTDGTPFNAQAVKENVERTLALGYVPADFVKIIDTIETPDDYTVVFNLKSPHAAFKWEITFTHFISPTAWKEHEENGDLGEKWLHDHAVGTGPYLVKEWKHGEYVHLVKNPDWWGDWSKTKAVEEVFVKVIPDSTTRKLLLMRGEIDVAEQISNPADLLELSTTPGVVVRENPSGRGVVTFQIRNHGPLADPRVRKAIALCFDYEGFARKVMQGTAIPGQGPLIKGAEFGFDDTLPPFKKDIEQAKKLLAEAGYPDGLPEPLELLIISAYQWFQKDAAQILQAGLAEVGIELKITDTPEAATLLAGAFPKDGDKEARPDMYAWTYNSPHGDPYNNLRQYHCDFQAPKGQNGSFYCNEEVSEWIDAYDASVDEEEQLELLKKIQAKLVEDQPAIWYCYISDFVTYRDSVQGYNRILAGHRAGRYYKIWLSE